MKTTPQVACTVLSALWPWWAQALEVPQVSLDLPRDRRCVHLCEVPANYGSTLIFASGRDVSTDRLSSLAERLCQNQGLSPSPEQVAQAIEEYETEHLPHVGEHPLYRPNFFDVSGLIIVLHHQQMVERARLIAHQKLVIEGRPMRVYYIRDTKTEQNDDYLGKTTGNNLFIEVERIREAAAGDFKSYTARVRSVLHHEQAHWVTTRELRYGNENAALLELVQDGGTPHGREWKVVTELGSVLTSIARSDSGRNELALLLAHHRNRLDRATHSTKPSCDTARVCPILLKPFLEQNGFQSFYIERLENRYRARNSCEPGPLERAWIRGEAEFAATVSRHLHPDYLAFLATLEDETIRLWARDIYEGYFGALPELPDEIPTEVLDYFYKDLDTPVTSPTQLVDLP